MPKAPRALHAERARASRRAPPPRSPPQGEEPAEHLGPIMGWRKKKKGPPVTRSRPARRRHRRRRRPRSRTRRAPHQQLNGVGAWPAAVTSVVPLGRRTLRNPTGGAGRSVTDADAFEGRIWPWPLSSRWRRGARRRRGAVAWSCHAAGLLEIEALPRRRSPP